MTRRRQRAKQSLRRLHRWLGISSAAFLILLCGSGLLLNHSSALGLDTSFVTFDWLLEHYGIQAPQPGPSFAAGGRTVTYLDGGLYVDGEPAVDDFGAPAGALQIDDEIVVVSMDELVSLGPSGELLERWSLQGDVGSPVIAIAPDGAGLLLRSAAAIYRLDWNSATIERVVSPDPTAWIDPVSASADLIADVQEHYRGRGLSWERLLADLHSGRAAGWPGVVIMDLAAIALLLLGVSGVVLWMRR